MGEESLCLYFRGFGSTDVYATTPILRIRVLGNPIEANVKDESLSGSIHIVEMAPRSSL